MSRAVLVGLLGCMTIAAAAQTLEPKASFDNDRDGLSDKLEGELLKQFRPRWMIGKDDCSVKPAQFASGLTVPTVVADDGTVYGQAFPRHSKQDQIELHFYHLWRQDCGQMGHALDAEHVAVLLHQENAEEENPTWRAVYWYAAAHEDTVCDASQITRASTVGAEDKGAAIWISVGKHASFLDEELCSHGCGGDRCTEMESMKTGDIVNLGELLHPVGGDIWISSPRWPLAEKMQRSDFSPDKVMRLERLPESDIAWANPAKRPAQAAIYGGNSAVNGISVGGRSTDTALVHANDNTTRALTKAQRNTGNALTRSYRNVVKALDGAATSTGKALGVGVDEKKVDDRQPK